MVFRRLKEGYLLPSYYLIMPKTPQDQTLFEDEGLQETKTKWLYNKYDLISYLIKSIRIWDKTRSLEIMWAMLSEKIPETYIARKLVHFASEDSVWSEAFLYAKGIHDFIKDNGSEINSLSRLVLYLCDSPKFWETEEEHYREFKRIEIRERMKKQYSKWEKPFEIPSYVYDQYTSIGKRRKQQGEMIDERVSWVLLGWYCMRVLQLQHGKLDVENSSPSLCQNEQIKHCIKNHITIDQYIRENNADLSVFL